MLLFFLFLILNFNCYTYVMKGGGSQRLPPPYARAKVRKIIETLTFSEHKIWYLQRKVVNLQQKTTKLNRR